MSILSSNSSLYKQQQFAIEYVKDQNQTQAAIRAGYARKGAAASGRRLMENPKVKRQIQQLMEEKEKAEKQLVFPHLEYQEVLDFLTVVLRGGQGQARYSLASEKNMDESEAFLHERMRAAELLGRYFHLFDEDKPARERTFGMTDFEKIQPSQMEQVVNKPVS